MFDLLISDPLGFFLNFLIVIFLLFVASGFFAFLGYFFFIAFKFRNREKNAIDSTLLEVALPRDNEVKVDAAEQLFSAFSSLHKSGKFATQPSLSFEIVGFPGDIRFFVHTPNKYKDMVEKQINGAYPDAEIKEVNEGTVANKDFIIGNDYNIFSKVGKVAFASLRLKQSSYLPLKVYKDLPLDSLLSLTSSLAKMSEGEGASVQFMVSPTGSGWKKAGKTYLSKTKKTEANPETAKYSSDPKEFEAIENKLSKSGFDLVIRIVVSSSTKESAQAHLNNIANTFSQFTGQNSFKKNKHLIKRFFMTDFIYRYMPIRGQTAVLTTEEMATIFHFPNKSVTTPGIFWVTSKGAPAPANLPTSGLYLGQSVFRGISRPVYIEEEDRRRHMYIIGRTGTGKTEFLKQMILQDIRGGKGLAVIDPHGDLIEDVMQLIPPERSEDVILFDPSDTTRPMGFNMLEAATEQQKHLVVTSIIGLMYKLFDPNKTGIIGPRFEHAIRNAMLTVMYDKGATFVEVVRALTDSAFVQELLPKVEDPIVRRYWTDQIAQTSDFHKSEVLDYITSKFGRFVTNKMMRNIIGQSKSAFDFRKVM